MYEVPSECYTSNRRLEQSAEILSTGKVGINKAFRYTRKWSVKEYHDLIHIDHCPRDSRRRWLCIHTGSTLHAAPAGHPLPVAARYTPPLQGSQARRCIGFLLLSEYRASVWLYSAMVNAIGVNSTPYQSTDWRIIKQVNIIETITCKIIRQVIS